MYKCAYIYLTKTYTTMLTILNSIKTDDIKPNLSKAKGEAKTNINPENNINSTKTKIQVILIHYHDILT